jgi:RNA polymerase sigma-70 factor (sigma-E family)
VRIAVPGGPSASPQRCGLPASSPRRRGRLSRFPVAVRQDLLDDRQPLAVAGISIHVETESPHLRESSSPDTGTVTSAQSAQASGREVTALYEAHALSLIRLAYVMLGDRPAAEDVVQEAFLGLHKRWSQLRDTSSAAGYLRASVMNGCRMALRARARRNERSAGELPWESAEASALVDEEHRHLLLAIRALPPRQREALVLRYYLDLSEEETARSMGIRRGTVKSATSRALAALGRRMKEYS